MAIVVTMIGLTACGDDPGETSPAGGRPQTSPEAANAREQLVLKTRVEFPEGESVSGEVLSGSRLGDTELCVGTTFRDRHSEGRWLVNRTLRCPGGQITLGFTPQAPVGDTQTSPWEIIDATGRYEGLTGAGEMEVVYEDAPSIEGRETFNGTLTR